MRHIIRRVLAVVILSLFISQVAFAISSFVVRHIRVQGTQRVSDATVLSYVPVSIGQRFDSSQSTSIIEALFDTGFFSNVRLLRENNTLIVRVVERPVIDLITIKGNSAIKTKMLKQALNRLNIVEGRVYNPSNVHAIKVGLKEEYDKLGRYSATVDVQVVQETRNRVAIHIIIHEGHLAAVQRIEFVGNHAFSAHELRSQFKLTTPGLLSFITHDDRYSKAQLDKDLESLKNFYLDHGYLRFQVTKKQVVMSKDRRSVVVTIYISEGAVYRISGYRIEGKVADREHIVSLIDIHPGEIFSLKKVQAINNSVYQYYANRGFAFSYINMQPQLNDKNHTVFLVFNFDPRQRVYVRRINFIGNKRTQDYVLRSQMRQMEASVYSLSKVNESKRKLANLPYLSNIQVDPIRVPEQPNEVDLNYHVTEVNAGRATVQMGYSDVQKIIYGANVSEPNFLGSGKYLGVGFQRSKYSGNYSIAYNNPFYTIDGIQRGFRIYYEHTKPTSGLDYETYLMDDFGAQINYIFPISEYDQFLASLIYDHISISVPGNASAPVTTFLAEHGSKYNEITVSLGWDHSTLDRAVFPTKGSVAALGLLVGPPVFGDSVGYYKASFSGKYYLPLGEGGFILSPYTDLGYGDGIGDVKSLPFFYNYFAGGIDTVPGYSPNSLGPKNPILGAGNDALGGNVEIVAGLNVIFPNPFGSKVRTAIVFAAGNVFQTDEIQNPLPAPQIDYPAVSLKNLRTSVGVKVAWYSPLGLIELSLAEGLSTGKNERLALFGFNFGGSL